MSAALQATYRDRAIAAFKRRTELLSGVVTTYTDYKINRKKLSKKLDKRLSQEYLRK